MLRHALGGSNRGISLGRDMLQKSGARRVIAKIEECGHQPHAGVVLDKSSVGKRDS